jgi:hypothetical protein
MNSAVRRPPLVPRVDRAAPLQFLRTGYEADDWIAVFLKRYEGPRRLEDPVHAERNGSSSRSSRTRTATHQAHMPMRR